MYVKSIKETLNNRFELYSEIQLGTGADVIEATNDIKKIYKKETLTELD